MVVVLTVMVSCGSDNGSFDEDASVTVVDTSLSDSTSTSSVSTSMPDSPESFAPETSIGNGSSPTTSRPASGSGNISATTGPSSSLTSSTSSMAPSGGSSGPSISVTSVSPSTMATLGDTVSISFTVSDPGGVSFVATFWQTSASNQLNACPNGMGLSRVSGSSTNASYQTQCTLPSSGIPSGTYTIVVNAEDEAGNRSTETATFNVAGGSSDVTGPAISVTSVSPSTMATLGDTVSISFTVSDPGGVSFVATFWQTSASNQLNACPNGMGLSRVSGSSTNASYQTQCTLPSSGIPSGTYTIQIIAEDVAGNRSSATATFNVILVG
jgi:ribosomal protein L2